MSKAFFVDDDDSGMEVYPTKPASHIEVEGGPHFENTIEGWEFYSKYLEKKYTKIICIFGVAFLIIFVSFWFK